MSEGLKKVYDRTKKKTIEEKTGRLYRGFGAKVSRVIVDILYREEEDIINAYKNLGHSYSSIAKILNEENSKLLDSSTPGSGKKLEITYYHISHFIQIKGINAPKKHKMTNKEKAELVSLLKSKELEILRRARKETVKAIAEDYKNATPYWINKLINGKIK